MPSMQLKQKVEEVKEFCRETVRGAKNPALMCSFGKDSMVLLHMLRGEKLPIVWLKDPWFPRKYAFGNRVVEDWDLEAHSYPPVSTSMLYGKNGAAEYVQDFEANGGTISIPKHLEEKLDGKWACGRDDFFGVPLARYNFLWDMCLVGHKDSDVDSLYGSVRLHQRVLRREVGPSFAFPLKDWTDEDVWDYTEEYEIPVDHARYDIVGRCEREDKTLNSDYYQACIRCIDKRRAGETVACPKYKTDLKNVSQLVPEFSKKPDHFDNLEV